MTVNSSKCTCGRKKNQSESYCKRCQVDPELVKDFARRSVFLGTLAKIRIAQYPNDPPKWAVLYLGRIINFEFGLDEKESKAVATEVVRRVTK